MAAHEAVSLFCAPKISSSSAFQQKYSSPNNVMCTQKKRQFTPLSFKSPKNNNPSFVSSKNLTDFSPLNTIDYFLHHQSQDSINYSINDSLSFHQTLAIDVPQTLDTKSPQTCIAYENTNPNPSWFIEPPPPPEIQLPSLPEDSVFIESSVDLQDGYIGDCYLGDFSSDEDQILLGPFLAGTEPEPEKTLDYPSFPSQAYQKEDAMDIDHVPLKKKPCVEEKKMLDYPSYDMAEIVHFPLKKKPCVEEKKTLDYPSYDMAEIVHFPLKKKPCVEEKKTLDYTSYDMAEIVHFPLKKKPCVEEKKTLDYPSEIVHVTLKKPCEDGEGGDEVSPQSMAARERRRRITERTSELGKIIPGGNKMSTAEMFHGAYKYIQFLKAQVSLLKLFGSSSKEVKEEEPLNIKEMEVLASPIVQEKLYSEEKCLIPKQFLDETLANPRKRHRSFS